MASLFWTGGTAAWDGVTVSFATTSGGVASVAAPTAADDVFFDASSGAVTITASASSVCRSLNCTGFTGTFTIPATTTVNIGDATAGASNIALKLVSTMTLTLGAAGTSVLQFVSTSATVQTVDFGGKSTGSVTFNGAGGSWQYASNHTHAVGAVQTLTAGTLDTNGKTCSWRSLASTNSNVRTLTLGASAITMAGSSGTLWNFNTLTNLTFNAGTSTITISDTSAGNKTFTGGAGIVYNNIVVTAGGTGQVIFSSQSFTVGGTMTITGPKTIQLTATSTKNFTGTLVLNGSAGNVITLQSSVGASQAFIKLASSISSSFTSFQDIAVIANEIDATNNGTDAGNNLGVIFSRTENRYESMLGAGN